ncbi:MAG TPA: MFS transporter [Jiangellaceae bacterium]|nr:MFS transporter [Jiangellaceae bacterium]
MSPTFRSLRRYRAFRLFWSGMLVSNVGTWMQRVAQDWLVLVTLGGGPAALGVTTGLQFLPFLLVAPFGGLLADRLPKRQLLMFTNGFLGTLGIVLGVLVVTDLAQVWHVYVLAFLLGVGAALDHPARNTFAAELVEPDDLANAVGLNSASFNGARLIGPGLAGLLIAAFGTGPVFLLNAVTFGAPIVMLLIIGGDVPGRPRSVPRRQQLLIDGVRYVRGRPDLVLVMSIMFFVGTFGMNFQMTTALMATGVFEKGPSEYGLLGSIMAIGSVIGSLLAARRGAPRRRVIVTVAVVFALLEILAGLSPAYWVFALSLIPLGVTALTVIATANAYVQTSVDPQIRGRVMALYLMVFMGGTPAGAPLIGWAAEILGPRWSLLGGGIMTIAGTLVVTALLAGRSGVVLRPRLRPRPGLTVRSSTIEPVTTEARAA